MISDSESESDGEGFDGVSQFLCDDGSPGVDGDRFPSVGRLSADLARVDHWPLSKLEVSVEEDHRGVDCKEGETKVGWVPGN